MYTNASHIPHNKTKYKFCFVTKQIHIHIHTSIVFMTSLMIKKMYTNASHIPHNKTKYEFCFVTKTNTHPHTLTSKHKKEILLVGMHSNWQKHKM